MSANNWKRLFRLIRRCEVVNRCLKELSDEERSMLMCRAMGGEQLNVVAKKLGITKERARIREDKAITKMCDMLFDVSEDEEIEAPQ